MGLIEQMQEQQVKTAADLVAIKQTSKENGFLLDAVAESLAIIEGKVDTIAKTGKTAPEPEPPKEYEPELIEPMGFKIGTTKHIFAWRESEGWEYNLEIGTTLGGHDLFWQEEPIEGGSFKHDDLPVGKASKIYARLWHKPPEHDHFYIDDFTDFEYELTVDIELPTYDKWPIDARKCDFRTTYNALSGFALMRQGLSYVDNFRFEFGKDGRRAKVSNQAQFDAARGNANIGVIEWLGSGPVVLFDKRRSHNSVQLLICDNLSHIRTWGNLAIDCQRVSRPSGSDYNIVAHGGNVLRSLPKGLVISNNDWGSMVIEPVSPSRFGNVCTQGGLDFNEFSAGRETVDYAFGAWQSNWSSHWDSGVTRPFDMGTINCGMQGSVSVNVGADTLQPVVMPSWVDPAKSNHPHGAITHSDVYALGVVSGITKDKWLTGQGEQAFDFKSGDGVQIADCLTSGFGQNHVGSNSSHGDGLLATHFYVDEVKVSRSIGHNQRAVEIGSGKNNLIEECFFTDPNTLNNLAKSKGLKPSGALGFVGYRETRYPWAKPGLETAIQARNNVFDHTPRHAMSGGTPLDNQGQLTVDKSKNVYADFGPLGRLVIGTTDPKAKESIWFAG